MKARAKAATIAGITICKGDAPRLKARRMPGTVNKPIYDALDALDEGQWFEVPGSEKWDEAHQRKTLTAIRNRIKRDQLKFVTAGLSTETGAIVVSCAGDGVEE